MKTSSLHWPATKPTSCPRRPIRTNEQSSRPTPKPTPPKPDCCFSRPQPRLLRMSDKCLQRLPRSYHLTKLDREIHGGVQDLVELICDQMARTNKRATAARAERTQSRSEGSILLWGATETIRVGPPRSRPGVGQRAIFMPVALCKEFRLIVYIQQECCRLSGYRKTQVTR